MRRKCRERVPRQPTATRLLVNACSCNQKANIRLFVLWGESTGHQWFPSQWVSDFCGCLGICCGCLSKCTYLQNCSMMLLMLFLLIFAFSPCPSVRLSARRSVCPSVDRIVSALYLQQYLSDPFHVCTSYQATWEGVSRVMFVSKVKNIEILANSLNL